MNAGLIALVTALVLSSCGPLAREDGDEGSSLSDVASAEALDEAVMAGDTTKPIIAASDPTKVSHCIYGKNVVLGVSHLGGGYINFAHHRHDARSVDCEAVKAGLVKNEANPGFGRGWQSALRDHLHSGRYNPTQAGFMAGGGRPVDGAQRTTVAYPGIGNVSRFAFPKFQAALFSDPKFDFTEFEDLFPDFRVEPAGAARDRDRIAAPKDGASQDHEVRSEFDFAASTEVWTDAVAVGEVDVFRHSFTYVYQREPRAILQFGEKAILEDQTKVIDEAGRLGSLKAGVSPPTDTDLSAGVMAFGLRFNKSAGFDTVFTLDGMGTLVRSKADRQGQKFHVPGGGDSNLGPLTALVVGGKNLPDAVGSLVILCQCDAQGNGRAWALYAPPQTAVNSQQVVGKGGGMQYAEDRRLQTVLAASLEGEGDGGRDIQGGFVESMLNKIEVKTYFTGLYAPGRVHAGTREAFRQEVFILHGSPDAIVKATAKLQQLLK